jgi:hypothetical protein
MLGCLRTKMSMKTRPTSLDRFLEQERTPVCTAASILTTVLVWAIVMLDCLTRPRDWSGLAQFFLLVVSLTVGSLINISLGLIGLSRHEYRSGHVSLVGIAMWLLTIAALWLARVGLFS